MKQKEKLLQPPHRFGRSVIWDMESRVDASDQRLIEAENTSRFAQVLLIDFHLYNAIFNRKNRYNCLKLIPFN